MKICQNDNWSNDIWPNDKSSGHWSNDKKSNGFMSNCDWSRDMLLSKVIIWSTGIRSSVVLPTVLAPLQPLPILFYSFSFSFPTSRPFDQGILTEREGSVQLTSALRYLVLLKNSIKTEADRNYLVQGGQQF
jgi:hypothetical protein